MLSVISKFFGSGKHRIAKISDPVLGTLRWSEEEKMWQANIVVGQKSIGFLIAGDTEPSDKLISHAQDIIRVLPDFKKTIAAFLVNEMRDKNLVQYSDEIQQLTIENVCLFWPNRPNDGMIYFKGLDKFNVWRCDYINRKPIGLGFDS